MEAEAAAYWLSWIRLGKIIAFALVAIGVAAEFIGEFLEKPLEKDIEDARELKLQELTKETTRLSFEGEAARAAIANAQARTAIAEQRAAEAQLALEQFKAPRTLSREQQERVVAAIHPFAGKQFDLAILANDPEVGAFLLVIESILQRSEWKQLDWKGGDLVFTRPAHPIVGIVNLSGVILQMDPSQREEFGPAAAALAAALNAEGIFAKAEGGSGTQAENSSAMHILIGKKP